MTQYTIPADGLVAKPAHELAAMIQAGEVTSREVTQAFLDRIAEIDDELGAFLHVGAEEALAAADKVDEQVKNGDKPASALAGHVGPGLPLGEGVAELRLAVEGGLG